MGFTAKFRVAQLNQASAGSPLTVTMAPNYQDKNGNKVNEEWSAATPSGEIKLTISNPAAAEQCNLGREFTVTFE